MILFVELNSEFAGQCSAQAENTGCQDNGAIQGQGAKSPYRADTAGQKRKSPKGLTNAPICLKEDDYLDVQAFMATYREAETVVEQYNRNLAEWTG